jgi:hypothetical protein
VKILSVKILLVKILSVKILVGQNSVGQMYQTHILELQKSKHTGHEVGMKIQKNGLRLIVVWTEDVM